MRTQNKCNCSVLKLNWATDHHFKEREGERIEKGAKKKREVRNGDRGKKRGMVRKEWRKRRMKSGTKRREEKRN